MNDEIVHWLEENKDVDVSVVIAEASFSLLPLGLGHKDVDVQAVVA
ncbi:MAG: hypothetical protein JWQ09_5683 [Segetibacter sp.]|nr:hypothetical protein [Segetibacter sp.]